MNGKELINEIQSLSLDTLLQKIQGKTKAETQSKRGNMFEKVADLIIKMGLCSIFPNDEYDHYEGNINRGILKKVDNMELYIQNLSIFIL